METSYELVIVMKPLLPDDIRKSIHKSISMLIKSMGGAVVDVDVWGKRYLAYKMMGHNEGYYMVYYFKLDSSNINEVKRVLKLKPELLNFLVVKSKALPVQNKIKKKEIDIV